MYNPKASFRGFTLLELLVVISIIGVLAGLIVSNMSAARDRASDARKKSEMKNIQTALANYYNDYGVYPSGGYPIFNIMGCGDAGNEACDWGDPFTAGDQTYMKELPADPSGDSDRNYRYVATDADNYVISVCLENASDPDCVDGVSCWVSNSCYYEVKSQ